MQILSGLILLAVLIAFHEFGHFLFAKMLGVRVLVFSLGFGPKLLGFKIGDTEYRLSLIPLGGYVRMFGESVDEQLSEEEKKRSFMHQATWRKSLIAFAGPLFNFILPVILFFCILIGSEQVYAPIVGTILTGSVADLAGIKPDDRIVAVNGHPVETFTDLAQTISEHPKKPLELKIKRPQLNEALSISVVPEAKPNPSPFEKGKMMGRIGIMPAIEKAVVMVDKDSAFYQAGLRDLDEVKAIDGTTIASMNALQEKLKNLGERSVFQVIRNDEKGQSEHSFTVIKHNAGVIKEPSISVANNLTDKEKAVLVEHNLINKTGALTADAYIYLKKNGLSSAKGTVTNVKGLSTASTIGLNPLDQAIAIDGEKISSDLFLQEVLLQDPKRPHVLGVLTNDGEAKLFLFALADNLFENLKLEPNLSQIFGISTASVFKAGEAYTRQVGALEALKRACDQTYAIAVITLKSLWMLITGGVSVSQVGGPIMIFDVAQQAAHKGLHYYIFIMCLLSVNLGLLNLLPIPALDGGHLLLFGVEAVQRRPLTPRTRAIATQIGIALLLVLMGIAIFNDLYRLFK
ncbi:MAG TPA: RIP metalloprotease RseP [Myxococcota bacterium]|nr:RIP metalloprotease RseP [Myxococcota bacterium]